MQGALPIAGQAEPGSQAVVYVLASEWEDLKTTAREARNFALEARDSSRANHQTIVEVVKPKMKQVEEHEAAIQRGKGAIWVMGIVYGLATLAVAVLAVAR